MATLLSDDRRNLIGCTLDPTPPFEDKSQLRFTSARDRTLGKSTQPRNPAVLKEYKGGFKSECSVLVLPKLTAGSRWRSDAVMPDGYVVPGDLWIFTTTPSK
jgi:hypothetical protein